MFPPFGPVAQLVRALACHARGRGFDPHPDRHFYTAPLLYASVAQLVEQGTENPRVVGSIPTGGTTFRGFSSFGRAPPCQGGGGGFEPRNPLQNENHTASGVVFCFGDAFRVWRSPKSAKAPAKITRSNFCVASIPPRGILGRGNLHQRRFPL